MVTLVFLLDQPYAPAEAITHEDAYFLKETFSALVQGLTSIDPHAIQADGVYIVPGNAADGLVRPTPVWPPTRVPLKSVGRDCG